MFFLFFRFSSQTCQNKQGPFSLYHGMCQKNLIGSFQINLKRKSNFSGQCLVCFVFNVILNLLPQLLMWRRAIHGWSLAVNKDDASDRCCLVSKLYRRNWPTELEFLLHFRRRWHYAATALSYTYPLLPSTCCSFFCWPWIWAGVFSPSIVDYWRTILCSDSTWGKRVASLKAKVNINRLKIC
jgi:hypothetical protein